MLLHPKMFFTPLPRFNKTNTFIETLGTMFDDVYSDCDFTNNVDCGDRPYPDGSTSPHPPTTSSTTSAISTTTSLSTTSTSTSPRSTPTISETPTTTSETTSSYPQPTGKIFLYQYQDLITKSSGSYPGMPNKVLGMYILLADDTEEGFHSDADWEPKLYPYQQQGANVLFFTFINPETMVVPEAYKKLGKDFILNYQFEKFLFFSTYAWH